MATNEQDSILRNFTSLMGEIRNKSHARAWVKAVGSMALAALIIITLFILHKGGYYSEEVLIREFQSKDEAIDYIGGVANYIAASKSNVDLAKQGYFKEDAGDEIIRVKEIIEEYDNGHGDKNKDQVEHIIYMISNGRLLTQAFSNDSESLMNTPKFRAKSASFIRHQWAGGLLLNYISGSWYLTKMALLDASMQRKGVQKQFIYLI